MATQSRRPGAPVARALIDEPYRFDFYEAVRVLEQLHPDRAPVGEGLSPSDEPVRFRTHAEMGFPASDVLDVDLPENGGAPAEMAVSFMSLAGPHGPLPSPYAELLNEQARAGDAALRDFLDLLAHRFVALQYRSRKRHHVGMESGRPDRSTVARYLRAVGGLGAEAAQNRLAVPDHALLRYAPLLNQTPASAHGLGVLLDDYFCADVEVTPLTGAWIALDAHQTTRLGPAGQNQALGRSTVLGARAWDQQAGLTIDVRASGFDDYLSFFPEGESHRALIDLAKLYLGRNVDLTVSLSVKAEDTPDAALSTLLGPRLGRDAWLGAPTEATATTAVQPQTFTPAQEVLRIPLFAELSPGRLQDVLDRLPQREVGAREHVARQSRPAEAFYVVMDGAADVRYQSAGSDEPTVLATLEPGGVFGDKAVIAEGTYGGSLVTARASRLLVVEREALAALVERFPAVDRALEERYLGPDATEEAEPQRAWAPQAWRPLRRHGAVQMFEAGTPVLEGGAAPASLSILLEGGVRSIDDDATEAVTEAGTPLNLDAVVAGRPQSSTLRATRKTVILSVPRSDLRTLVQKHAPIERALCAWRA